MKKLIGVLLYTGIVLIIGKNISFLPSLSFLSKQQKMDTVKTNIQELIAKKPGIYSIFFYDLQNNESFTINAQTTFTAASVNKVPIVTVLYEQANQKKINLDEKITMQKEDIQDYGTGKLRYEKPGNVYSLRTLAKLSLQISDNTAAYLIATRLDMKQIQKTVIKWGMTQTDMAQNKTSLTDTAILFKKIYLGEIANSTLTMELLDFMHDTDIEDRIPALLPKSTVVYHKTGDTVGTMHDVGIIKNNKTIFFLGVMTTDIGDKDAETRETIARIAKKIFDIEQED